MVSPLDDQAVLKIWDSLRKRYNMDPNEYRSQQSLEQFLSTRDAALARTISKTDFWNRTQNNFSRTATYVKEGKVISYSRTYNRWTLEAKSYVSKNRGISAKKLAESVNRTFGTSFTSQSVGKMRQRLGR